MYLPYISQYFLGKYCTVKGSSTVYSCTVVFIWYYREYHIMALKHFLTFLVLSWKVFFLNYILHFIIFRV